MHLHRHLKECITDYGPVLNFWLFGFERYNGILESYPANSLSVEIKMFLRFQREFSLSSFSLPQEFDSDFADVSLQATVSPNFNDSEDVKLPNSFVRSTIDKEQITEIKDLVVKLNPGVQATDVDVNTTVKQYSRLEYSNSSYLSGKYSLQKVCVALAKIPSQSTHGAVHIHYFVKISVCIKNDTKFYILACVSWLKEHHKRYAHGKPLELWWKDLFETSLPHFIPLQWLAGQCVYTDTKYEAQTLLLLCPV